MPTFFTVSMSTVACNKKSISSVAWPDRQQFHIVQCARVPYRVRDSNFALDLDLVMTPYIQVLQEVCFSNTFCMQSPDSSQNIIIGREEDLEPLKALLAMLCSPLHA